MNYSKDTKYVLEEIIGRRKQPRAWSYNRAWLEYVAMRKTDVFPSTFKVREMKPGETNIPSVGQTVKIANS